MFHLSLQDIHLAAAAADKQEAITQIAAALTQAGYADEGYLQGMLNREQQTSTYLGNGIAIPHGTPETRDRVLHTGVQVFQFPQGVEWGEGQKAYVVIGIAARSDEHLALLRQLTRVLDDEGAGRLMATTTSLEEMRSLLMGERQVAEFRFDAAMVSLDIPASNLMTLQALNAGRLREVDAVNAEFVSDVVSREPLNLGQGIWLSDSALGNQASAAAVARPRDAFMHNGEPVGLLLTVSMVDEQPEGLLGYLAGLLQQHQAERLLKARDAAEIVALLTSETPQAAEATLSAEFVLRNEHGLHARPGTVLVNVIKQFHSQISIANLDGSGVPVNGRSLMKVVALGIKKGHRLRITAQGEDAQRALDTIGQAINQGLGEEVA